MNGLEARTKGATWTVAPQVVLDHLTDQADSLGRVHINQCELAREYGTTDKAMHRVLNRLRELGHLRPLNAEEERPRWHLVATRAVGKPDANKPRKIIWE